MRAGMLTVDEYCVAGRASARFVALLLSCALWLLVCAAGRSPEASAASSVSVAAPDSQPAAAGSQLAAADPQRAVAGSQPAIAGSQPAAADPQPATAADPQPAAALRARYVELRDRLRDSAFGLALYVDSKEQPDRLAGDLYGVVSEPFAAVRTTLADRAQWCGLLLLHINVKDCRASTAERGDGLVVQLGGKNDVEGGFGARLDYRFKVAASNADYLAILLSADTGPYGTTDHRIALEATSLPGGRTFLHLSYSHGFGPAARIAMTAYLSTIGRNKVGFTVVGRSPDGEPVYVNGVRGVVERNCMRYFLAVIAYLRGNAVPPERRVEQRLADWFDLTERYPRQLRELTRERYFATKLPEYRRLNQSKVIGG